MGIPLVINPDAHSEGELAFYEYGVDVARRGWLEKDDVFNTRSLKEVVKELEGRKKPPVDWISRSHALRGNASSDRSAVAPRPHRRQLKLRARAAERPAAAFPRRAWERVINQPDLYF